MLDEIVKEKKFSELTLKGNQYEGIFLAEQRIEKIKLEDKFPAIWIYRYSFEGKGIIKDKKTNEEQKIFLSDITDRYITRLRDYIIYFDEYLNKEKIKDYASIIDLQLQRMYKKAERKRGRKAVIHPEPLKIRDLIKKGFVNENKNAKE